MTDKDCKSEIEKYDTLTLEDALEILQKSADKHKKEEAKSPSCAYVMKCDEWSIEEWYNMGATMPIALASSPEEAILKLRAYIHKHSATATGPVDIVKNHLERVMRTIEDETLSNFRKKDSYATQEILDLLIQSFDDEENLYLQEVPII